jgi:hypothetical protein
MKDKGSVKMVRVALPAELHKAFKTVCAAEGYSMQEKFVTWVDEHCKKGNKKGCKEILSDMK